MKKILLAAINAKYIHSNLAVYSLKAYADERLADVCAEGAFAGVEIEIGEYTINQQPEAVMEDIYRRKPDLLCFSCYIWNIQMIRMLLPEIRKVLPETEIWLGGPEVSYDSVQMLAQFPQVRGIMKGEGEETFAALAARIAASERGEAADLEGIEGITCRNSRGQVEDHPWREPMDMDKIPFVYQDMTDFRHKIVYYESSRGCPFSCSYCLSSIDKCLRFRDPDLVRRELQFFIDHEVPQVKFVDRTFNCRHDHAMAVWSYIKEHDRGITNFHFEVAADLLNDEEIALIRSMRPGLIQLEIGVQSTNPDTVREIRRRMDLVKVEGNVAAVREARNVHQHLDLIAGLPYEDYDSFARSFDRVYAMKPDQLQLGFLKVLKGSLMHEKTEEYGLVYQDRPPYEVLSTKWLSYSDVIRLKKIEEMVEVYYNSGQFRNTMEQLEQAYASSFEMYGALADYYEKNGLSRISHSRIARYEILHHFIEETEGAERIAEYREWLTLDLYLRDNVKNRPAFLGENRVTPDEAAAFYKAEEEERRYLSGYEGYDRRQMRKMTHLEKIREEVLLFDYRKRNPLNGDAAIYRVEMPKQ